MCSFNVISLPFELVVPFFFFFLIRVQGNTSYVLASTFHSILYYGGIG